MISCKRATELISQSFDQALTRKESLDLRLHKIVCSFCRLFERQLRLIRRAISNRRN